MSFKTSVYELDSIRTGLEVSLSSIHNVSLDSDILTTASEGVLAALNMETRLDVKGWHLLAAGFGVLALTFCRGGKPPKSDANGYTRGAQPGSVARHRLTKIRASKGHFPPPYPNGWFQLCRSDDVPKGEAIAASACNQEFCVFRDGAGVAAVLHAFCPHLGTHLGHGGKVVGGNVVCPHHSWAFDGSGKCANIPYCPKDPTERTNTKAFPSRERCGFIFVWLHADDEQPDYELTLLDEIEEKNMTYVMQVPVENWQMHNMEPSLNSADPYHFNTVHSWLGAKDGKRSLLWVRHECKTRLDMLGHTRENGEPLDKTWIVLDEKVVDMRLFGIIPLPKFFNAHYSSGAAFQGPQVSVFRIDSPFLGAMRLVFGFTPEAPFEQRCVCHVFKTPGFPGFLARIFGRLAMATINQDRKVWEHKINVAPKNVVAGDGPFAAYGMWLRRFYSKSSKEFGDLSLEW
jgi:cholesterol 7-dehydrogenase